jgi:RNA polymerase sigma-70 factor, ECF subfamily
MRRRVVFGSPMNQETFERLYADYAAPLYGFLAYRTGNRALAEDLLADTFERAWTSRRRFDLRRGSRKTWLYAIALNRLRDQARRDAVEDRALHQVAQLQNGNGSGNGTIEHVELRQLLLTAMDSLEDPEREALSLRYGGDLSLREIADVLGVPRSTVEGRIYRGLKRLSDKLVDEEQAAVGKSAARS